MTLMQILELLDKNLFDDLKKSFKKKEKKLKTIITTKEKLKEVLDLQFAKHVWFNIVDNNFEKTYQVGDEYKIKFWTRKGFEFVLDENQEKISNDMWMQLIHQPTDLEMVQFYAGWENFYKYNYDETCDDEQKRFEADLKKIHAFILHHQLKSKPNLVGVKRVTKV